MDTIKTTLRGVPTAWTMRTPFDCNGTLRGTWINSEYQRQRLTRDFEHFAKDTEAHENPFGRLPLDWGRELVDAMNNNGPIFVVYSYETPIAWVDSDNVEIKIPVKYSATTSKHMGKLYKV